MGTTFDELLAVGHLVASIDVPEFTPATLPIKNVTDKDVNLEDVSARFIDKTRNLKNGSRNRSNAATQCFESCGKTNNNTKVFP